jgi:hypothetical protein
VSAREGREGECAWRFAGGASACCCCYPAGTTSLSPLTAASHDRSVGPRLLPHPPWDAAPRMRVHAPAASQAAAWRGHQSGHRCYEHSARAPAEDWRPGRTRVPRLLSPTGTCMRARTLAHAHRTHAQTRTRALAGLGETLQKPLTRSTGATSVISFSAVHSHLAVFRLYFDLEHSSTHSVDW